MSMTAEFRLRPPVACGSRTIIPVVGEVSAGNGYGMFASVRPVALLIGEDGEWGIALLEGDSVAALLEKLVLPV